MKRTCKLCGLIVLAAGILTTGCAKKQPASAWSLDQAEASAQLKQFVAAQETQARALAKQDGMNLPPDFDAFFKAAGKGDWQTVTNLFERMAKHVRNDSGVQGSWWSATLDAYGVFEMFPPGDKYATAFGNDIIQSIPDGSIYFGGTDPGRFVVTALTESHADGKPFFVLSQNPLTDGTYLQYLRSMYAGKIYIPTDEDLQKSFQDYTTDAQHRLAHDQQFPSEPRQIKPGEDVRLDANGRIQLSGQMNVIGIRELLTKTIFDKNPGREFYLEESFPLDWMYPQLEPHGLIFKLNRQALSKMSDETVQSDHDYWAKYVQPMIGGWLNDDTSVAEVAAFAGKTFGRHDFSGFKGDPRFIENACSHKMFSKLRSSIAGLYAWRVNHAAGAADKERMAREADFAFRQAWVLCPYSPEAVYRYVNFLLAQNRGADAVLVAETAAKLPEMKGEAGAQMRSLVEQLKNFQKQK